MHFIIILIVLLVMAAIATKFGYAGLLERCLTVVSVGIIGTGIGCIIWAPIVLFTALPVNMLAPMLVGAVVAGWVIAYFLVK